MIGEVLRSLRAWRGDRRRIRRRLELLDAAGVAFVSPAKSGRTWVRAMLSHLYHLEYGTPVDEIVTADRFHRLESAIPVFFFTHGTNEAARVRRAITPQAMRGKVLIGLVRDPRDVAVSRFHHYRHRPSAELKRLPDVPDNMAEMQLFDFVRHETVGMKLVIRGMNWLKELADGHPSFSLFRYEDIRADPHRELGRLTRALGHGFGREKIAAAVEFARFENLRKREQEGFFRSEILKPGDASQPDSYKVRRGKVGGYRDDLDPDQRALLDRMIDEALAPGFGYRSDERTKPQAAAS